MSVFEVDPGVSGGDVTAEQQLLLLLAQREQERRREWWADRLNAMLSFDKDRRTKADRKNAKETRDLINSFSNSKEKIGQC